MKFVMIAVVVLGLVWFLSRRAGSRPRGGAELPPTAPTTVSAPPARPQAAQSQAAQSQAAQTQATRTPQPQPVQTRPVQTQAARPVAAGLAVPPGTRGLDEPDAVRPDIDARALATARAAVTPVVPDAVLSDALLDASPEQLQRMFAAVPTDVMSQALGKDAGRKDDVRPLRAEDRKELNGLGDALDDLDIWSFGDDNPKA